MDDSIIQPPPPPPWHKLEKLYVRRREMLEKYNLHGNWQHLNSIVVEMVVEGD
jgi:hypothetical protein